MTPFELITTALVFAAIFMRRWGSNPVTPTSGMLFGFDQYAPYKPETNTLFTEAATRAGLPTSWATSPSLHQLLAAESGGWVGIPNYQFAGGPFWGGVNRDKWPAIWGAVKSGGWQTMIQPQFQAAPSSATGLGQLTATNIKSGKYYPSGLNGIGNPLEEAIGMLRYIAERYQTPDAAWAFHQQNNWY
jgi:hypothetical protein